MQQSHQDTGFHAAILQLDESIEPDDVDYIVKNFGENLFDISAHLRGDVVIDGSDRLDAALDIDFYKIEEEKNCVWIHYEEKDVWSEIFEEEEMTLYWAKYVTEMS